MNDNAVLNDVLVVTIRKHIWASPPSLVFPHRLYEKRIGKNSQNRPSVYLLTARAFLYALRHKPKAILFGSAHKTVPRFIELKQRGFLKETKLITVNQMCFDDAGAEFIDKIMVYSRGEIALHKTKQAVKYEFMPIPVDGQYEPFELARLHPPKRGDYIFCGGVTGRDFRSLIEAVRGLDVRLKLVAFSFDALGYRGTLPENCDFYNGMPEENYVDLMANAMFVAVPLKDGRDAHGHTTVAQALVLGKAVLTTKGTSVDDYVTDGCEGLMALAGDVAGYREAILRFQKEPGLLDACEQNARLKAKELTYEVSAERLVNICRQVLAS